MPEGIGGSNVPDRDTLFTIRWDLGSTFLSALGYTVCIRLVWSCRMKKVLQAGGVRVSLRHLDRVPSEWLQAGFSGSAYRLAHFRLPRFLASFGLAALFLLA